MNTSAWRATSGHGCETRHIIGWAYGVCKPREPVLGILTRICQNSLCHMLGFASSPMLLPDKVGHLYRGIGSNSGVIIHVEHPNIVPCFVLKNTKFVGKMVRPCLEPCAVRGLIPPRHSHHANQIASGCQAIDPLLGLTSFF